MVKGRTLIIGVFLAALAFVALINFSVSFSVDNNASTIILNDPTISASFSNLNQSLQGLQPNATAGQDSFFKEALQEIPLIGDALVLISVPGFIKTMYATAIGMFDIIGGAAYQALGIPPFVFNVLSAIFLVTLLLAAWRIFRAGD